MLGIINSARYSPVDSYNSAVYTRGKKLRLSCFEKVNISCDSFLWIGSVGQWECPTRQAKQALTAPGLLRSESVCGIGR